jgi:Macrocin-O-methyltransferase (TylF)
MTKIFDGMKKNETDLDIENLLEEHCQTYNISALDAVKNYTILTRRHWFKRQLAHIELFKLALSVPGDIAELGVFRGSGLFTWANLLESYSIGDRTKTVYGFDNWKGFTGLSVEDSDPVENASKFIGGFNPKIFYEELNSAIKIFDLDRFVPWKERIKLINGDIEESIPEFLTKNPGIRFSIVHFDCDLYAPTKIALNALWSRIPRGGILIFDEYGIHDWPGETKAVDEFLDENPMQKLQTFNWTNVPGAFLIKT